MVRVHCRNAFLFFSFSLLFLPFVSPLLVADAVIKQMSLGNGKTQGDISVSNSPAPALWGRQGAECLNRVCVFGSFSIKLFLLLILLIFTSFLLQI